MAKEKVLFDKKNRIVTITINNPPVNALDAQVIQELDQAFSKVTDLNDVLAVIVTGAGEKAFIAGADISQFPELREESGKQLLRKGHGVYQKIADTPCPVICAINGFAFGGGLELALACDIRVIAENAKVGVPEVSLGLYPGYGGTQRLPRLIGKSMAKKLIFTGSPIDAAEACRIGLCDQMAPAGKVLEAALQLAQTIATRAPLAVTAAKKVIDEGMEMRLKDALPLEIEEFGKLCETEDKNEGAKAFMEKRKAVFQGK